MLGTIWDYSPNNQEKQMNHKTNGISSSIPRTFGMALLSLALSTGAAFAESAGAQSAGGQARDAHILDAESLEALQSVEAGTVRAREITPLDLVFDTLGTTPNAIDAWSVHCPGGTHHIHFDVGDFSNTGPAFGIVAQDFETGRSAVRRAPQGGISAAGQQNGGSGIYVLHVFKTAGQGGQAGTYDTVQVCHNAGHGLINHSQHFIFQDQ
jgi:hypothetical protein